MKQATIPSEKLGSSHQAEASPKVLLVGHNGANAVKNRQDQNCSIKEVVMSRFFAGVDVGRKNVVFGVALFLILGVVVGVPLTVDLFGGSMLTESQYQTWKVLHAYGVFTAFVNFFFGFLVDRMSLGRRQLEIASWSFLIAGLVGGIGRPVLFLFSLPGPLGSYAISLIETVGFVIGTLIFVRSQLQKRAT